MPIPNHNGRSLGLRLSLHAVPSLLLAFATVQRHQLSHHANASRRGLTANNNHILAMLKLLEMKDSSRGSGCNRKS